MTERVFFKQKRLKNFSTSFFFIDAVFHFNNYKRVAPKKSQCKKHQRFVFQNVFVSTRFIGHNQIENLSATENLQIRLVNVSKKLKFGRHLKEGARRKREGGRERLR